jgi:hypothetical protein
LFKKLQTGRRGKGNEERIQTKSRIFIVSLAVLG